MATAPVSIGLAVALGLLMHWWPRLGATWRWRLSILTNAAGLAALVAATRAEGSREAATTSVLILGSYHTATASASASLYYYVLTAFCLLLGFAGLVVGETLSRWLAPRALLSSVAVAWLVTVVRFLLEKSAAPEPLVQAMGVTWLPPVAGAYLATALAGGWPGLGRLARVLVAYSFLVRGFVAVVGVSATWLGLGTHYDVSALTSVPVALTGSVYAFAPGGWGQVFWLVLVPQLVVWPVFTVATGLLGGATAWAARRFV